MTKLRFTISGSGSYMLTRLALTSPAEHLVAQRPQRRLEVEVDVAEHQQERQLDARLERADRMREAQRAFLLDEVDPHAVAASRRRTRSRPGSRGGRRRCGLSAMPQSRITSIWWASSGRFRIGRIGFGTALRERIHPRALAGGQDDADHAVVEASHAASPVTLQRISSRMTRTASNARIFLPSSNVRPEKLTGTSVNRAPRCASRAVNSASKSKPLASMCSP